MPSRILHVIDLSTPPDALEMLASLLRHGREKGKDQLLVGMGHRVTGKLAERAGIETPVTWVPSLGWGDPSGWCRLRRAITEFSPSHVHAWGIAGVVATAFSGFSGKRIGSFLDVPSWSHVRALRFVDQRRNVSNGNEWKWIGTSPSIVRALQEGGLTAERVIEVRPAIRAAMTDAPNGYLEELRRELEIGEADRPVILLGGEGRRARHDYGLWTTAILQQIYPRLRVIVRDDVREKRDEGLSRFLDALPDEEMLTVVPAERRWEELLRVADLLLVTPDGPIQTGSILAAMAAGVPVIGTPVECVTELVEDGRNGLLARELKPRSVASRLEAFIGDVPLRQQLTEQARMDVKTGFDETAMLAGFDRVYER
jgi:Glycosyl transferases group 1